MSLSTNFRDGRNAPSLLAMGIALAIFPNLSQAAGTSEDTIIVEGSADSASETQEQDYSVRTTSAGTKMEMAQRDIPQSVSIITEQRMRDQQLQTLGDVMDHTMGISSSQADSDRTSYYSRGFEIDNYMVDGIPTWFESRWNLGDALSDMALFERVEVVRGANGLLTGTGNPAASVNMIRKHATSREFKGNVSAEYGSWNKQRYVADMQSPLTDDGSVRARIIAGYQNNDSWLDRYNSEKTFFSGILDADLGTSSALSAGYEYQRIDVNSPTWGGLPRWNTDGSKNRYDRAHSTAPDWAYNDKESNKVFVTLKQRFADTWQATLNATHSEITFDSKMMYVDAYVNKATGMLVGPYSSYGQGYDYVGGTGWNSGKRKVDAVDLFADGGYDLFGRQHNLMIGTSYSKQNNRYFSSWANVFPDEVGNFYSFNSATFPETSWGPQSLAQDDTTRMKSLYAATRFVAEDNEGNAVNPNLPRTSVKLFTRYRLPVMPELTVGGGVNWQNRVYKDTATPYGTFRAEQGSYALVDVFTRYQVTKNFAVQGNVNNLFDKTYDTNVDGSIVYGEPRNVSITASYQF